MIRNIRLLKWFNFCIDFRLYSPIAIIYFVHITGSYAQGIAVFSIAQLASAFFEVPTGLLSDMVGRKKTMIFGTIASTLAISSYAFAGTFILLAVGAVFEGLSESFWSGNNSALLYDSLKSQEKEGEFSKWYGRTEMMLQIGLGISALLGGFIAVRSLSLVMKLSIIPQAASIIFASLMREPKVHSDDEEAGMLGHLKEAIKRFKESYQLRLLSIASIIDYAVEEAAYQFYPAFFATLWPIWAIGVVRALSNLTSRITHWFADTFTKRWNAFRVLIGGEVYARIVGIFASAYPTMLSPLLLSLDFSHGSRMVAQKTLMQERFSSGERATMGSLNSFFGALLFAVVAYGIGLIADVCSPAKAILVAQIVLTVVLVLYWKAYHVRDRSI